MFGLWDKKRGSGQSDAQGASDPASPLRIELDPAALAELDKQIALIEKERDEKIARHQQSFNAATRKPAASPEKPKGISVMKPLRLGARTSLHA